MKDETAAENQKVINTIRHLLIQYFGMIRTKYLGYRQKKKTYVFVADKGDEDTSEIFIAREYWDSEGRKLEMKKRPLADIEEQLSDFVWKD